MAAQAATQLSYSLLLQQDEPADKRRDGHNKHTEKRHDPCGVAVRLLSVGCYKTAHRENATRDKYRTDEYANDVKNLFHNYRTFKN